MVIEAGVVVGYVIAWALRKAGRIGRGLDEQVDRLIDAGLEQLDETVASKLGDDPSLQDLGAEAAQGQVSDLTRQRVELAVKASVAKDPAFASHVQALLQRLKRADPDAVVAATVTMTAAARDHGRVYQAGRDQHVTES